MNRCVELALSMIDLASSTVLANGEQIKMKIGMHTGAIASGVVGYHKPQFVLVGDTINTSSRMATTLEDYNAIQMTKSSFKWLENKDDIIIEKRTLNVKGKGQMRTYVVK